MTPTERENPSLDKSLTSVKGPTVEQAESVLRDFVYVSKCLSQKGHVESTKENVTRLSALEHTYANLTPHSKVAALSITSTNTQRENKPLLGHT